MNKAKLHFWQLTFSFLLLVVVVLGSAWSNWQPAESDMMTQMMSQSMGEMMRMMHASNITLAQLLWWNAENGNSRDPNKEQSQYLVWVHTFTTNVVFLLTPLVLGGAIFLLIMWHWSDATPGEAGSWSEKRLNGVSRQSRKQRKPTEQFIRVQNKRKIPRSLLTKTLGYFL